MVHKLFTTNGFLNGTVVAANVTGAKLAAAAVIGVMFAYECARTQPVPPAAALAPTRVRPLTSRRVARVHAAPRTRTARS